MTALPRYFFDVHNAGAAEWDHTGSECEGRADIENTVKSRLAAFAERYADQTAPVSIAVLAEGGSVVLTATGQVSDELRLHWR